MSGIPDIGPAELRTFAEAEQAGENLPQQIDRARQVLRSYYDVLAGGASTAAQDEHPDAPPTAREQAAQSADPPDLHPKA